MKTLLTLLVVVSFSTISAQSLEKKVGHFAKVVASPKINVVLVKGDNESVKINYSGIEESKINVVVKNNSLHIYLDKSKFTEKRERVRQNDWEGKKGIYSGANITAYITYRHLDKLVVRGEQVVDLLGVTENSTLKLSAYGRCEITVASLQATKFKAALYGNNTLMIKSGEAGKQKYKLFGDNRIEAQALSGQAITSTTYGESKLRLNANEHLKLNTFGESNVIVKGSPEVDKFTLGQISLKK